MISWGFFVTVFLALSLIATVYDPTPKSFSAFWLIENGGHDDIHTLTNDFPLNLIKLILWIIYSLMRALIEEKMEEVVFEFLQLRASFVGLVFSLVPVVGPYLYILSYVFGASTICARRFWGKQRFSSSIPLHHGRCI